MSTLETRLLTIRRALLAFRDTPGRCGRFIDLPDAEEVLVGGDMHGNMEHFRRLMQLADLGKHPQRHLILQEVIHGPFRYPTGGDKSHQLLDLICALKCQHPRQVHFLLGNHELAQLTGNVVSKHNEDLNSLFAEGVLTTYGPRGEDVYSLYCELFRVAPVAIRAPGGLFFSHSLPTAKALETWSFDALCCAQTSEDEYAPGGAVYALVWGRDVREETVNAFLERVGANALITGHIPCEQGFTFPSPRHLILDTQGHPAAYALMPADRAVTTDELHDCVHLL